MSFFEKSLTTLELPAVLVMLAAEAVSEPAKERARELSPSVNEAEVRRRLEETSAAKTMMVVRGSPSFSGVKDVRPSLARADLGGALNTRELLDSARVLRAARLHRRRFRGQNKHRLSLLCLARQQVPRREDQQLHHRG